MIDFIKINEETTNKEGETRIKVRTDRTKRNLGVVDLVMDRTSSTSGIISSLPKLKTWERMDRVSRLDSTRTHPWRTAITES